MKMEFWWRFCAAADEHFYLGPHQWNGTEKDIMRRWRSQKKCKRINNRCQQPVCGLHRLRQIDVPTRTNKWDLSCTNIINVKRNFGEVPCTDADAHFCLRPHQWKKPKRTLYIEEKISKNRNVSPVGDNNQFVEQDLKYHQIGGPDSTPKNQLRLTDEIQ